MASVRRFLVTGATSGLGKASAAALACAGQEVILLARDRERGEAVRSELSQDSSNARITLMVADLASQASIREFSTAFCQQYDSLNGLLNCAGIRVLNRCTTADGVELMFGSEYLGHFLLTNLLVPALKVGAPSRIITISGEGHKAGVEGGVGATINFADILYAKKWDVVRASKQVVLAKILFTYELARRLKCTGVAAHTVSPRFTRTNLSSHYPWFIRWIALLRMWQAQAVPPAIGANDVLYPLFAPELEGQTGKYFVEGREAQSSPESYDAATALHLWEVSEELVHQKFL
ncbi:MAG TPA: SDR family NAD(P)-dependent oxidoreductase [Anaerolineales bacterium]|nr:SDR family NAD(P)-dependent oxidoreductase [Anaerolineales bacterium]